MTALPKVDTAFPGADCLLCMATASLANSTLTGHVQSLTVEDLPQLKRQIAKSLQAKGLDAVAIDEALDLKNLPSFSSKVPNFATKDFTALKARYKVDKLLAGHPGRDAPARPGAGRRRLGRRERAGLHDDAGPGRIDSRQRDKTARAGWTSPARETTD